MFRECLEVHVRVFAVPGNPLSLVLPEHTIYHVALRLLEDNITLIDNCHLVEGIVVGDILLS